MKSLIFPLPENCGLAASLASRLNADIGQVTIRRFPDGEFYLRIDTPVEGREVIFFSSLDRPDGKILPLLFLAATAKDLKASRVGLVSPYLAYMRQDHSFQPGEGVSSLYFARLLAGAVDWLVTVDPHLHRYRSLGEIYPIPTKVVHAELLISHWIRDNIKSPLLIGPDSESAQWVAEVAQPANLPYVVLEKIRNGDREVEISVPDIDRWRDHTPVLVDDIISTGQTMIKTVGHLKEVKLSPPVCIGIHAIFADNAYDDLLKSGVSRVVTCNTVRHISNVIDVSEVLAKGVREVKVLPNTV